MNLQPVSVSVPATSANLGPGFDSLGMALSLHDQATAQVLPDAPAGHVAVDVAGEGAGADTDRRAQTRPAARAAASTSASMTVSTRSVNDDRAVSTSFRP